MMEQDFGLHIFYKESWIQSIKVSKTQWGASLEQILTTTLSDCGLSYIVIQNKSIILVPDDYSFYIEETSTNNIRKIGSPLDKGKYNLNRIEGIITYGKTEEPLSGAIIVDLNTREYTTTNKDGYYRLNLQGGNTKLEVSFVGLETSIEEVEILGPGMFNIQIMEEPINIEAVTITANRGKNNVEQPQMGMVHLDIRTLNKLPVLMGEPDIIKSMTLLPGISSTGEMSSGFNVRGGSVDQNLILLDETPLYSTSHLFGLFSAIIPDAVNSVNMYKGTQPAKYGTRASSVMEIGLKTPDTTKVKGKAGIGLLNSTLFIEGPATKNKRLLFMAGGRVTYSNWLLQKINNIDIRESEAGFYDLTGRLEYRINRNNNISAFAYGSNDDFKYSTINKFKYSSKAGAINYRHFFNNIWSLHSSLTYSSYNSELSYIEDPTFAYTILTGINQINGRIEGTMYLDKHEIISGIEGVKYNISPGEKQQYDEDSEATTGILSEENALEFGVFIQDNYKISNRLSVTAGLRFSWYSKIGQATIYNYDPSSAINENSLVDSVVYGDGELVNPYYGIEPRIGIKYSINNSSSVKVGYNITRQYQHLISNSASAMPSDFWKSADNNIKPLVNNQLSVGYFKNFLSDVIESSVEVYYKTTDNILDYKNGAILTMNANIEQDIVECFAKSYGIEFMLKKNIGKLTGWASYTLSNSLIKTNGEYNEEIINNNEYYASNSHRLHDLSLSANYKLTRRWTLASNFIYTSGRPTTLPEEKYYVNNIPVVRYSERNQYRLPAYHRLDISATYEGFLNIKKKVHPSFTFSIYNVYAHKNIYSIYYKEDTPSSANNYNYYALRQLSIIGVPIPSLTINLTF